MSKRHWNKREKEVRQELKKEVLEVIEKWSNITYEETITPLDVCGKEIIEELKGEIVKL